MKREKPDRMNFKHRTPRHERSGPDAHAGSALRLVLATAIATAALTLLVGNLPTSASAYTQSYNCESFVGQPTCHLTAGSWHDITNVGASNYDVAGDICAQYGQLSNTYTCALSGYSILLCEPSVYQYGISETQYGDNDNISGHEDDSTSCE